MHNEHKYIINKKLKNKLIQLLTKHKQKTKKVENIIKIYNNLNKKSKKKFNIKNIEVIDLKLKRLKHEFKNYIRSKYKKEINEKIITINDINNIINKENK